MDAGALGMLGWPSLAILITFFAGYKLVRGAWFAVNTYPLTNKVFLVTGGGSGLGRALVLRLAQYSGSYVAVCDVNFPAAQAVCDEIPGQGRAGAYCMDVTHPRVVQQVVSRIELDIGRPIDVLINNAGIVTGDSLLLATENAIRKTFEVNVLAHVWTLRACLPSMMERNSGCIVTIASAAGLLGVCRLADYSASKAAAFMLHESVRAELKKGGHGSGVRTLLVCPYFFGSGMFTGVRSRLDLPGLLRIGSVEENADRIILAMSRGEQALCMPWMVSLVPLLRGMLPVPLFDWVSSVLGVHDSMDTFRGRVGEGKGKPHAERRDTRTFAAVSSGQSSAERQGEGKSSEEHPHHC